jgi:hypothetical protein
MNNLFVGAEVPKYREFLDGIMSAATPGASRPPVAHPPKSAIQG